MYQVSWVKDIGFPVFLVAFIVFGLTLMLVSLIAGYVEPEYHVHADIIMYVNEEQVDLTSASEASVLPCIYTEEGEGIPALHLVYSDNGYLIHSFHPESTYANFFASLGMTFEDNRFIDDKGVLYESSDDVGFHFFVNKEKVTTLADRTIQDLDQVLISIGPKETSELVFNDQLSTIKSEACLASAICSDAREVHSPCEGFGLVDRVLFIIQSWF